MLIKESKLKESRLHSLGMTISSQLFHAMGDPSFPLQYYSVSYL